MKIFWVLLIFFGDGGKGSYIEKVSDFSSLEKCQEQEKIVESVVNRVSPIVTKYYSPINAICIKVD